MKTMAIRLEDELHAQLTALSQLEGLSITDVIRASIEGHLLAKRSAPELATRADEVLASIDAEAAERRNAIAALFGDSEPDTAKTEPEPAKPSRRKTTSSPAES